MTDHALYLVATLLSLCAILLSLFTMLVNARIEKKNKEFDAKLKRLEDNPKFGVIRIDTR